PSESCGCEADAAARELRLEKMRNLYAESNDTHMVEFFFQEIRVAMAKVESKEEFHEKADLTLGKRSFFGTDYCLCTEPRFFEEEDNEILKQSTGFSPQMDILYEHQAGGSVPQRTYPLSEIYPGYQRIPGESHVYVISPMNNSEMLIGYLAIKDYPAILYDLRFKRWINNMETLLINIRQYIFAQRANRKLREIYMTDFLTGMYNRTGCDAVLFQYIREEKAAGRESMLLFADINCMKKINDEYGHLNGDLAIKATAKALMKSLPGKWLFCRYGGDEFIAVGQKGRDRSIEDYRARFNEELSKIAKRLKASFYLSASLGYYIITPEDTGEIEDFIHKADASMYEEKERAHEKIRTIGMNADPV
ncbi:MAG: GGDEF domain-containing protein, partial [Lachnospiraceae bacterium]|nr:GGDEF domain-containing protein [Lachnospiraceae bacterium]